ncbi:alpha/beta-Hydrolase [Cordyceps javanica]|uniref:Alpha/beta-Hydrolase n=1 Tax=Cordyceps javanica TaxID=43265 RepID=A0A545VCT0_9HYPO|nr:alpha/beta-Hydrolase [Cordyceps javanica]TQW10783.1 alpha/beta-Hydrolase [Cordyceps javanica]
MARKTLVLCFIHGFRGGNLTFGENYRFTEHLRDMVAKELPKINVKVLVYPKYETRGDLGECVMRFRTWLEEKVIDLEVAAGTTSPTIEPSVRTVLVGHSMGGIMAVESLLGIASEQPIYSEDGIEKSEINFGGLLFPYVQGVLAFDTPFLGISPGVVAHGAEGHYQAASATLTQLSGLGASLWGANQAAKSSSRAVSAPPPQQQQQKGGGWPAWGKVAMVAGAAGAVAAGGAAAWLNREQIGQGLSSVTSHLEFVGCLARAEELRKRVRCVVRLSGEMDLGFANLYTRLGRAAAPKQTSVVGTVMGRDRTFCNLPGRAMQAGEWKPAVNDKATDEIGAHTAMFEEDENPGYDALLIDAAAHITKWLHNDWYESSTEEEIPKPEEATAPE